MYEPVPPRPKLTDITRTRTGCKECRKRRVKCDERKPSCGACVRRGRTCEASEINLKFRNVVVRSDKRRKKASLGSSSTLEVAIKDSSPGLQITSPKYEHNHEAGSIFASPRNTPTTPPFYHPSFPNPDLVRSLNRSENELFYLTHWDYSCLEALDYVFQIITSLNGGDRTLKHSILALSACNLSRFCPERDLTTSSSLSTRMTGINNEDVFAYRPHRQHQAASQFYYTSALRQVAKNINESSCSSSALHTLAALIVFCYIESVMGNFSAFSWHAEGILSFIRAQSKPISAEMGHRLLSVYILSRYQNWWRRLNFSSSSFQRSQPSLSLSADIVTILRSIDAKKTLVTSILCESFRINTIAFLQVWEEGQERDSRYNADKYVAMLGCESRKLDDWESILLPSELPNEPLSSFNMDIDDCFSSQPLLFNSHDDAMNYAYYVVARIMQCTAHFTNLQHIKSEEDEESIIYWIGILIRIVTGLDKQECAKRNVYSIGISSLLMACLPRCSDLRVGQWIANWLHELSALSILEEGSFPVEQTLAAADLVNRERSIGNEILAINLPQDDGGGGGKYSSYCSQRVDRVVIKWRRKSSDKHHSDIVSLWAEK